jgi:hypothetical protein
MFSLRIAARLQSALVDGHRTPLLQAMLQCGITCSVILRTFLSRTPRSDLRLRKTVAQVKFLRLALQIGFEALCHRHLAQF